MFTNPITGRAFIFTGYPPSEEEYTTPDPSLTIAIISFCVVGPFWLIGKFVERVAEKMFLSSNQDNQRKKELA